MTRETLADLEVEKLMIHKTALELDIIEAEDRKDWDWRNTAKNQLNYVHNRIYKLTGEDLRVT